MPLADLLVCSEDELLDLLTRDDRYEAGAWLLAKRIDSLKLSRLGELLGLGSYESLMAEFELVGDPMPDGPWPERFPASLPPRLASLSDDEVGEVCERWVLIDELEGWQAESLETYLRDVREFLRANPGPVFLVNAL